MAIPTSGTYDGLYVYSLVTADEFGAGAEELATAVGEPNVLLFEPIASGTPVTFDGSNLSFTSDTGVATTLPLTDIAEQGSTGFGFYTGGSSYVVSNGALAGGYTLDTALSDIAGTDPSLASLALSLKANADSLNLGNIVVLPNSIFDGNPYQAPCFVRGTLIRTPRGDVPVETLGEGDRVTLAQGGQDTVVWVGTRRLRIDASDGPELRRPIRVGAGALGDGLPLRDLVVSPDHALFLDGVLVPAGLLVDGARIRQERVDLVEYVHVELTRHGILLAEGAPAESYLDTGNRQTFSNASLVSLRPELSVSGAARVGAACAEMVLEGPRLEAIRARLAGIALPDATRLAS